MTTIDLKDSAVASCYEVVAGDLAAAARGCQAVIERAELYDAAEESEAVSIEDFEANYAGPIVRAKERATCSQCLARTYRNEECVCRDGGDAEDYDEARLGVALARSPPRDRRRPCERTATRSSTVRSAAARSTGGRRVPAPFEVDRGFRLEACP